MEIRSLFFLKLSNFKAPSGHLILIPCHNSRHWLGLDIWIKKKNNARTKENPLWQKTPKIITDDIVIRCFALQWTNVFIGRRNSSAKFTMWYKRFICPICHHRVERNHVDSWSINPLQMFVVQLNLKYRRDTIYDSGNGMAFYHGLVRKDWTDWLFFFLQKWSPQSPVFSAVS